MTFFYLHDILFICFAESENEALRVLNGNEIGAKLWMTICVENEQKFAVKSYLAEAITDRLWETTNRNLQDSEQNFIKSLLPKDHVSLAEFSSFWTFYSACEALLLTPSLLPLWKSDFIHGFCGKEETLAALEKSPSGTFILRFTTSAPGKLALSYTSNGKISHLMIAATGDDGGFLIGNSSYASFNEILEKSRVFTHVHPDKPIQSFESSLLEAAGKQKVALNCYGSELPGA